MRRPTHCELRVSASTKQSESNMSDKVSSSKARKILRDGSVRGHKLTGAQKRYFGLIAGGGKPTKVKK